MIKTQVSVDAHSIEPPSTAGTNLLLMKSPVENETSPLNENAGVFLKLQLNVWLVMAETERCGGEVEGRG